MSITTNAHKKQTSSFITCWLPIILWGIIIVFITSSIDYFTSWWRVFSLFTTFLPVSAFILKKANKSKISMLFAVALTVVYVIEITYSLVSSRFYIDKYVLNDFLHFVCSILLALFIALPDTKIKSFFFVFPLFIICFSELVFSSSDFMLESCYFLGFLTTNTFYCSPKQYDKKKSLTALARLENLARLKEQGMLTDEDFRTKKAEIMEQM